MVFFPQDPEMREKCRRVFENVAFSRHHTSLAWRKVPVNNHNLGNAALRTEPVVEQWFVRPNANSTLHVEVEVRLKSVRILSNSEKCRQMFVVRRLIETALKEEGIDDNQCYICSLSSKTIVYKGQLTPAQVRSVVCGCL